MERTWKAQGWCGDPFRLHEARWFSVGNPTALVRDQGVESKDPPPNTRYCSFVEPVSEVEGELLHAQEGGSVVNWIWSIFVSTGGD